MKTIKYLADGTIARIGMRVKCDHNGTEYDGIIHAINPKFQLWGNINRYKQNTLREFIAVKTQISDGSLLFDDMGYTIFYPDECTPIK